METWELFIKKAQEHITLASSFFYPVGLYSFAAFHAHQSLELSIKACAYKFGFELYLKNLKKKKKSLRTHQPAKVMMKEVYHYLIERSNAINRRELPYEIDQGITDFIKAGDHFVKTMEYIEQDETARIDVWKHSLGIPIKNPKLEKLINSLETYSGEQYLQNFFTEVFNYVRRTIFEAIQLLRKARQSHKMPMIKRNLRESMKEHDLPENLIDALLDNKYSYASYYKEIHDFVKKKGEFEALHLVFSPKGLLHDIQNTTNKNEKEAISDKEALDFTWMSYLIAISYMVVLTHPHQSLGRYPEIIDNKEDSETLYSKHGEKLKSLIDECKAAHERIKKMIS